MEGAPNGAARDEIEFPADGDITRGVEGTDVVTGSDDVTVVTGAIGLKPPGEISVEPIGTPDRPTAASPPIPVGDDTDAAAFDEAFPPAVEHVPDAVPELPPSKRAVGLDMPEVIVELAGLPQAELLPLIVPATKLLGGAGLMPGEAS